jgi:MFS family permease
VFTQHHQYKSSIATSLLAFGASLMAALFYGWEAHDLIWSVWLGALFVGIVHIISIALSFIISGLYQRTFQGKGLRKLASIIRESARYLFAVIISMLVILLFFSAGFFAANHMTYILLLIFAPMPNFNPNLFSYLLEDWSIFYSLLYEQLMEPYFTLIIAALISQFQLIIDPISKSIQFLQERKAYLKAGNRDASKLKIPEMTNSYSFFGSFFLLFKMTMAVAIMQLFDYLLFPIFLLTIILFGIFFFPFGPIFAMRRAKKHEEWRQMHRGR